MSTPNLSTERLRDVAQRRTFAIISHPDAGKTTLTEKLLLFGGAINLAGQVKAALESGKPSVLDVRVQSDIRRRTSGSWDMPPLKGTPPNFDPDPLP